MNLLGYFNRTQNILFAVLATTSIVLIILFAALLSLYWNDVFTRYKENYFSERLIIYYMRYVPSGQILLPLKEVIGLTRSLLNMPYLCVFTYPIKRQLGLIPTLNSLRFNRPL